MIGVAKQGLEMLQQAYQATVGETIKYAEQVRDLSRTIGSSAEESSKLIQAADDVKVSTETLSAGLEAAIRKGVKPTIEGIAELADEYNAIADPIARTKFLMDNFGRSGADLAPLMEKGADGIRELGQAAEDTGLVLSQDMVDAARENEIAADNLNDHWTAFSITLTNAVLPPLNQLMNEMDANAERERLLIQMEEQGIITLQEHSRVSHINLEEQRQSKTTIEDLKERIEEATQARLKDVEALEKWRDETAKAGAYTEALSAGLRGVNAEAARWQGLAGNWQETADAIKAASDAASEAKFRPLLEAGLSGVISGATEQYNQSQAEISEQLEKTRAELEKYESQQGKTVTVTEEATVSQAEYANAQFDAETAAIRLTEAQAKLNENTDPEKQRQLEGAILDAAVAMENAQEKARKYAEGLGESNTITLDYTTKIGELKDQEAELLQQQEQARQQRIDATNQLILQNTTMGLNSEASLEVARALGLVDEESYALSKSSLDLYNRFDAMDGKMGDGIENVSGYASAVGSLASAVASLQDRHITITVDIIQREMSNQHIYDDMFDAGFVPEGDSAGGTVGGSNKNQNNLKPGEVRQAAYGAPFGRDTLVYNENPSTRPEVPILNQDGSGYVLTKQDAQEVLAGAAGGPSLTQNFYLPSEIQVEMAARRAVELMKAG